MKEALLALISTMLMEEDQIVTIQKLFNIMDESGEGTLDSKELIKGYSTICKYYEGDELLHSMDRDEYIQKIE